MTTSPLALEALHPSLWRASQLARATTQCVETGHSTLSMQLPGGGWPIGTLTELLLQQPGIGELRLLGPALAEVASRRVVLLEPPHPPQALALAALGLAPENVIWLRSGRTADTLCVKIEKRFHQAARTYHSSARICEHLVERR